jgi:hypothetical protein
MKSHNYLQDDGENGLAVLAFKIQTRQFDLNRDLKYISMKDQIIRGRTLILGARRAGLIGKRPCANVNEANVVIIGGGIGGVSAALAACQLGLKVKVFESSSQCFSVLGLGTDRLFSATVYDWPHRHSGSHEFPFVAPLRSSSTVARLAATSSVLRFPDRPVQAAHLRKHLLDQLAGFQSKFGDRLEIYCECRLDKATDIYINPSTEVLSSEFNHAKGVTSVKSEIVVFALGFGLDKNNEQTEAGREFFSYALLGNDVIKAMAGGRLVRIVGAGDGGLQEALRFMFAEEYQDFHKAITALENSFADSGNGVVWTGVCADIQTAEDHAAKSLMWGYAEEVVYSELDEIYQEVVRSLITSHSTLLEEWRREVSRQEQFVVELVDGSGYSKRVYALNRFLIMLLQRLAPVNGFASLRRVTAPSEKEADVELIRAGFSRVEKPTMIGTAGEEDLLRRIAFKAIPMNLDAVV